MRIALFSYAWPRGLPAFNPGVETLVRNLAVALSHTADVTVFSSRPKSVSTPDKPDGIDLVQIDHDFHSGIFQANQFTFAKAVVRGYGSSLSDYDVLHDVGSLVPFLSEEFSKRGIVTFYHYENPVTLRDLFQSVPVPLLMKRERHVPTIIAVSEFAKEQVVSIVGNGEKTTHVIPIGVDLSIFHPGHQRVEEAGNFRLLFVGSLIRRKDPWTLLRSLPILGKQGFPVKLTCIGTGPEEKLLRRYVLQEGLSAQVDFVPHASTSDLVVAYRSAHLVIVPSRLEGFGTVAIESMACGTPVIHSKIQPLLSNVGDGGKAFEPGNATDLAGQIGILLGNADLRADLRTRGLSKVRNFDWARIADSHSSVYESTFA